MVIPSRWSRSAECLWYKLGRRKSPARVPPGAGVTGYRGVSVLLVTGLSTTAPLALWGLVGMAAVQLAGPSTIISIFLASLLAILTGTCFAELRSRVPRVQATAYEYIYCVMGEAAAFMCGWLLITQNALCTSAVARTLSQNFDQLLGNKLTNLTRMSVGRVDVLDSDLDFMAFFLVLLTMIVISVGLKQPSRLISWVTLTLIAIILLFTMVLSLYHLDFHHWKTPKLFFSGGTSGVFLAVVCVFFGFTGFEQIMTSLDFTLPSVRRPMALAIASCYVISLCLFMGLVCMLTLMSDTTAYSTESAFSEAFRLNDITWMAYVISGAGVLVLLPVLLVVYNKLVTVISEMCKDGLLPLPCTVLADRADLPVIPVIILGVVTSFLALLLSLRNQALLMGCCSLGIHALVALSVLSQRYRPSRFRRHHRPSLSYQTTPKSILHTPTSPRDSNAQGYGATVGDVTEDTTPDNTVSQPSNRHVTFAEGDWPIDNMIGQSEDEEQSRAQSVDPFEDDDSSIDSDDTDIDEIVAEYQVASVTCRIGEGRHRPTERSHSHTLVAVACFMCASVLLAAILTHAQKPLLGGRAVVIVSSLVVCLVLAGSVVVIVLQPQDRATPNLLACRTPAIPWLPLITLFIIIHLIIQMPGLIWIELLIAITIGVALYLGYGLKHSEQADRVEHIPDEYRGLLPGPRQRPSRNNSRQTSGTTVSSALMGEASIIQNGGHSNQILVVRDEDDDDDPLILTD